MATRTAEKTSRRPQKSPTPAAKTATAPAEMDEPVEADDSPVWALAWDKPHGIRTLHSLNEIRHAYEDQSIRVWIDLAEPSADIVHEFAPLLGLHALVVEDILERNQRAKVEVADDTLHLVMFALRHADTLVAHEFEMVLGHRFLLTVHDNAGPSPREAPFRRRDTSTYLAGGPDFVLWAITDWLVDGYFPVFDEVGDQIDGLEEAILDKPSRWIVEQLFDVRKDLLTIRHSVTPQREIFNQLTNRDVHLIKPERVVYFRDVYDHLIRLTDELDSYRELVSTTLDIYLSQINNNLSEIMKRLTSVTVILASIGAIAGIFGMSEAGLALDFAEQPGFWVITALTLALAGGLLLFFRRIGWI
jgi:magnesium transporter